MSSTKSRARREPLTRLEHGFPLPPWSEANERRYGRQLEVVAGFYSAADPGRDLRAQLGLRRRLNDWFVDVRFWLAGCPTPTSNGVRISLADWHAFAELVGIITNELTLRGIIGQAGSERARSMDYSGCPSK